LGGVSDRIGHGAAGNDVLAKAWSYALLLDKKSLITTCVTKKDWLEIWQELLRLKIKITI